MALWRPISQRCFSCCPRSSSIVFQASLLKRHGHCIHIRRRLKFACHCDVLNKGNPQRISRRWHHAYLSLLAVTCNYRGVLVTLWVKITPTLSYIILTRWSQPVSQRVCVMSFSLSLSFARSWFLSWYYIFQSSNLSCFFDIRADIYLSQSHTSCN